MTLLFEGRLTLDQMSSHIPFRFELPEGVGTLRIDFSHTPHHPGVGDIPHQLSISVYGPNGARGTRHNNADQSPVISTRHASPGYLPGPIEPGEWCVEIDCHRILPPGGVSYRLAIDWQDQETEPPTAEPLPSAAPRRRGKGWYRGDLHGHTLHSDGRMSIAEYLAYAQERGLDFVALTDHNTVSAISELERLAGEGITILPGTELTTYHGHALVLGSRQWQEWRVKDGSTMSAIADAASEQGQLFVIAHPQHEGHPFCTGCHWAWADMMPGPARHVEVWNGPRDNGDHNDRSLALFYHFLNQGYRMIATSGTDTHRRAAPEHRIPVLMVEAEDNTVSALLSAIRRGRSYITGGPLLEVGATDESGRRIEMGETAEPGQLSLSCRWTADDGTLTARLIRRGDVMETATATGELTVETEARSNDWFVIELRDALARLHAVTNPIFLGGDGAVWY
ncbi:CehA/McbA family metallohydrolase [Martelella endophytica]|uniref:CehA/McbA family metallohydrolase n=1 Tax=Martelella endophytica TaxID=1486262 RepID=UPI0005F14578|nr:CehA/McbA family metallohydrolase [Martelella endophytica]